MSRLIIGHTTEKSSRIWLRGDEKCPWAQLLVTGPGYSQTFQKLLDEDSFFTGIIDVDGLAAASRYKCEVKFLMTNPADNNSEAAGFSQTGSFKTAPQDGLKKELTFMFGSCNMHATGFYLNPDKPFRRLLALIDEHQPDFMLHCGDQIYYDIPNFWKHPKLSEYRNKYLDAWGDCVPAKELLANIPNYMILDDHEMVDNFSNDMDGRKHRSNPQEIREHSLKAYQEFQHSHNPWTYGEDSFYFNFSWGGKHFFVMDGRTERWAKGADPCLLGKDQMQAFKDWLIQHKSELKFVVCAVPFVAEVTVSDDKWSGRPFRKQREHIMNFLLNEKIDNLIFLSGDMHHSYYAKLEIRQRNGGSKVLVHELMSSPINNRVRRDFSSQYDNGKSHQSEDYDLDYITEIHEQDIYASHSNVTLVRVNDTEVRYEIYRTRDGLTGWMEGANPVRQGRISL